MTDKEQKETEKKLAGEKATEFVKDGMIIGLGTGSTVYYSILKIGDLISKGLNIKAVSSSNSTTKLATSLNIPLINIDDTEIIDVNIDGADEVDLNLNGIKGGGGALLFEKIVAVNSKLNIWVADSGKLTEKPWKFPLPVEVIKFGYKKTIDIIRKRNYNPVLREKEGKIFLTDSGNYILDICTEEITDLKDIDKELKMITGVVETGVFTNIADILIIGQGSSTKILKR